VSLIDINLKEFAQVGDGELKNDTNTWKQCYIYRFAKQKWLDKHTIVEPSIRNRERRNRESTNARCAFGWCGKLFKDKKFAQKHLVLKHSPNESRYVEPQQPRQVTDACSATGRAYFESLVSDRAMLTNLETVLAAELMESVMAEMITDILVSDECKRVRKRAKETHALQQLNSSLGVDR